jgi:hypothetical protein
VEFAVRSGYFLAGRRWAGWELNVVVDGLQTFTHH